MHAFSVCTMLESSDWLYIKAEHRNTQSPQLSQWSWNALFKHVDLFDLLFMVTVNRLCVRDIVMAVD